jgi:tetratricopeptide (TPR) repeat protein
MSRFRQGPGGDPRRDDLLPSERRVPAGETSDEPRRWGASDEPVRAKTTGKFAAGCLAMLMLPLILGLIIAFETGSFQSTDAFEDHMNQGQTFSHQQKLDEAMQEFEAAKALRPNSADVRQSEAMIFLEREQWTQCEATVREGLALNANHSGLHVTLGLVYDHQNEPERAMDEYRHAMQLEPSNVFAHYNMAVSYARLGRKTDAISEFEACLRYDPEGKISQENVQAKIDLLRGDR